MPIDLVFPAILQVMLYKRVNSQLHPVVTVISIEVPYCRCVTWVPFLVIPC